MEMEQLITSSISATVIALIFYHISYSLVRREYREYSDCYNKYCYTLEGECLSDLKGEDIVSVIFWVTIGTILGFVLGFGLSVLYLKYGLPLLSIPITSLTIVGTYTTRKLIKDRVSNFISWFKSIKPAPLTTADYDKIISELETYKQLQNKEE